MECPLCHTELPDNAAFCHRCGGEVDGALEPSDYRYAAFISYRHLPHDTEIAKQVQHAIETFRMPRGVSGRTFPDWPRSSKPLGNCFRDEDELSATHSLPESIQRALAQSRSLVVVCSPQTEESPWVRQEIEMFAQLHGRNRIVCILASGSSDESIPPALKTRLMPDSQGVMREMPSQPLAADLRAPSKPQRKLELLRIIAAVAGCNFDDLRQRQRTRKHRRIAIASLAAAALLALVAALIFASISSAQNALIVESKSLAAASHDQFAHGDRMAAIEIALAALPSSESDRSRPLVPEAQEALEDALLVYQDPDNRFRPYFVIDCPNPVTGFAVDEEAEWIAVLDEKGIVHGHSGTNGKERYTIDLHELSALPEEFDVREWRLTALSDDTFVVANFIGSGNLSAFDGQTGELIWEYKNTRVTAIQPAEDGTRFATFGINKEGFFDFAIIDTASGHIITSIEATDFEFDKQPAPYFFPCCFSVQDRIAALYLGASALCFNLDDESYTTVLLGEVGPAAPLAISSLMAAPNTLLAALYYAGTEFNGDDVPCGFTAIEPFSEVKDPIWATESTYDYTLSGSDPNLIAYNGSPRIQCLLGGNELSAVCTAGQVLSVRSCSTGEELFRESFQDSVLKVASLYDGDPAAPSADIFFLITSGGDIDVQALHMPYDAYQDDFRCTLPNILDQAEILTRANKNTVIVAHAADLPTRVLVYGCRTADYAREGSLSLDQLIGIAHWLLAAE